MGIWFIILDDIAFINKENTYSYNFNYLINNSFKYL